MSSAGKIRTVLRVGPSGWSRIGHTLLVARRIERSLKHEQLDVTASRFGARLSFGPPDRVAERLSISDAERAELRIALAVLRTGPGNGTCLRRALVMADVLQHHRPVLRVGVTKEAGLVEAHAWLEVSGIAVDPMSDREFVMLRSPSSLELS